MSKPQTFQVKERSFIIVRASTASTAARREEVLIREWLLGESCDELRSVFSPARCCRMNEEALPVL